jgi:hypothetical protein
MYSRLESFFSAMGIDDSEQVIREHKGKASRSRAFEDGNAGGDAAAGNGDAARKLHHQISSAVKAPQNRIARTRCSPKAGDLPMLDQRPADSRANDNNNNNNHGNYVPTRRITRGAMQMRQRKMKQGKMDVEGNRDGLESLKDKEEEDSDDDDDDEEEEDEEEDEDEEEEEEDDADDADDDDRVESDRDNTDIDDGVDDTDIHTDGDGDDYTGIVHNMVCKLHSAQKDVMHTKANGRKCHVARTSMKGAPRTLEKDFRLQPFKSNDCSSIKKRRDMVKSERRHKTVIDAKQKMILEHIAATDKQLSDFIEAVKTNMKMVRELMARR